MTSVRALKWMGPDRFELRDEPAPTPSAGEIAVEIEHVGLCGTDLHIAEGAHPRAKAPLTLGHEIVGRAISGALADQRVLVDPLLPCGDCVSCRDHIPHACERLRLIGIDLDGGLAERILVRAEALHAVPDDLDPVLAPLAEPVAVAVHAIERGRVTRGQRVVVVGAGPIGLLLALLVRDAGARVSVVERSPERADVARELGFALLDAADPLGDLLATTSNERAEVVFDAAAAAPVAALVTELVRPRGRVVVVGSYGDPVSVDLQAVTFRELELIGSRVYSPADLDTAVSAVSRLGDQLRPLVTDVVPLDQVARALDQLRQGRGIKVLARVGSVS